MILVVLAGYMRSEAFCVKQHLAAARVNEHGGLRVEVARLEGKGILVVVHRGRADLKAEEFGIEIVQRRFIRLAVGGDALHAVVDEHLLEGAHGVGGVLAVRAVGGAEEIAQVDEAALGAAHVAVFVALLEGVIGVGDLIVEQQRLRGLVGDAIAAQIVAALAEERLEIP